MLLVYLSLTGNVRRFVNETKMKHVEIDFSNPLIEVNEDFVVIVPSYDNEITETMSEFIDYKNNKSFLKGISGSGSLNYNDKYCFNAKDLAVKYNKPLVYQFEFFGTSKDIEQFKKEVTLLGST